MSLMIRFLFANVPCASSMTSTLLGESRMFRNFDRGALLRGVLRRFVANCAAILDKITGISFFTAQEKVRKLVANSKINFGQFYADTLFPMPLCPNF